MVTPDFVWQAPRSEAELFGSPDDSSVRVEDGKIAELREHADTKYFDEVGMGTPRSAPPYSIGSLVSERRNTRDEAA